MNPESSTLTVVIVFLAVYLGIAVGRWPLLKLDRTGIALVGAIVLVAIGGPAAEAVRHVDFATVAILLGLMVLSAQFAAAGFYDWCAARLAASSLSDRGLLGLVIAVTGALSVVLANDIVVFAMTPILCRGLLARGSDPKPFLLGHAAAANAGSAGSLIGNPQNILIGEHGDLDFWHYALVAIPAAAFSLVVVYGTILLLWRGRIGNARGANAAARRPPTFPAMDRGALVKAVVATAILLLLFATELPRWQSVLLVTGGLLISRRLSTKDMLGLVDWHLLVLFVGLFVVTGALSDTGLPQAILSELRDADLRPDGLWTIAAVSLFGSNTVGNVPLVMLVLAAMPDLAEGALYALALLSTLAGNLLIVGSIANLILVERGILEGVRITFWDHARVGVPMTLLGMTAAAGWLALVT